MREDMSGLVVRLAYNHSIVGGLLHGLSNDFGQPRIYHDDNGRFDCSGQTTDEISDMHDSDDWCAGSRKLLQRPIKQHQSMASNFHDSTQLRPYLSLVFDTVFLPAAYKYHLHCSIVSS